MSVMASASGQQIDIAASVRAAYQFARDNARLAVNLALVPFATVVGGEFLAWARLSLVFPAAAIERPMTLREGWDVMAGNYWRLFACILGCYLPFGIVHYVIDKIGGAAPSILWIVFQAVALAVSFAGVAVVAAMLSDVYRGFYPPEPQAERRAS